MTRSATLKIVNLRPSEDYKVQWEQVSLHIPFVKKHLLIVLIL